jgi:hypothetical protein
MNTTMLHIEVAVKAWVRFGFLDWHQKIDQIILLEGYF